MGIEQRRHIRFSLDIPAIRQSKYGEAIQTILHQISIGGCLLEWDENIFVGDELRILAQLPNGNYLPLMGKALYIFNGVGIGMRFLDITKFEQELLAKIITHSLEVQNLPIPIDPFAQPKKTYEPDDPPMPQILIDKQKPQILTEKQKKEEILEDILSLYD